MRDPFLAELQDHLLQNAIVRWNEYIGQLDENFYLASQSTSIIAKFFIEIAGDLRKVELLDLFDELIEFAADLMYSPFQIFFDSLNTEFKKNWLNKLSQDIQTWNLRYQKILEENDLLFEINHFYDFEQHLSKNLNESKQEPISSTAKSESSESKELRFPLQNQNSDHQPQDPKAAELLNQISSLKNSQRSHNYSDASNQNDSNTLLSRDKSALMGSPEFPNSLQNSTTLSTPVRNDLKFSGNSIQKIFIKAIMRGNHVLVPTENILEITQIPPICELPEQDEDLIGLMVLRGEILPILSLTRAIPSKSANICQSKYVVICRYQEQLFGIPVDQTSEVVTISLENIQDSHDLINTSIFKKSTICDEKIYHVIEPERILA